MMASEKITGMRAIRDALEAAAGTEAAPAEPAADGEAVTAAADAEDGETEAVALPTGWRGVLVPLGVRSSDYRMVEAPAGERKSDSPDDHRGCPRSVSTATRAPRWG
jgi:hypothetical protein